MAATTKPVVPPEKSIPATIRIAILESDPLRFVGFRAILESEPDFQVVAADANSLLEDRRSDVVILGTRTGQLIHTMRALKAARPDIKVIVTGPGSEDEDILQAISAGAKGYVNEAASPEQFKQAIRVVNSGSVWASRHVLSRFIERVTAGPRRPPAEPTIAFSERERQVLRLLVDGNTNKEIGNRLGIEERTVKAYIAKLMQKVGVTNRIALSVHTITNALLREAE